MPGRVLIVDDEANHRRSLSISLRMEGFEVASAADGMQALSVAARESFDFALMDLMMPGVDGLELARRFSCSHRETRVVLMSANHLTRAQINRAGLPHVAFLPKPYELQSLLDLLSAHRDHSGAVEIVEHAAQHHKALGA